MTNHKSVALRALILIVIFTVICGILYPVAMTGISQVLFKDKANGSIIEVNGVKYGSALLAQQFTGDEYLWGRPMMLNTETFYDKDGKPLLYAGASNKTPAGEELEQMVKERTKQMQEAHPDKKGEPVPVDLVTVSGSGLDPHISLAAAEYQLERVAKARNMSMADLQKIIDKYTTGKTFGVFGEKTVNVLQVNLALEGIL